MSRPITTAWQRFVSDCGCKDTFEFCINFALMIVCLFAVWGMIVVIGTSLPA